MRRSRRHPDQEEMIEKLQRLLRHHRQEVFHETAGERHGRAIVALKRTKTFSWLCQDNQNRARQRRDESLTGMGY